jgi:very-short-patch-repair endonuclease
MIEDMKWAAPDRYEVLKELARKNRLMPTLAETVLWEQIRGKALGTKFFRQYIIADYIVDFVSLQHNLVIEVDGAYHSELEQHEYDEYRTFRLERLGFHVIRFSNEEIINSIGNVVKTIQTKLSK